jgi:hypothetical protein
MSHWPQFTYLALLFLGLGATIATNYGKPRGPAHTWASLIGAAIGLFLLQQGGFFQGMFGQ